MVTAMRSFFRFLFRYAETERDFSAVVPTVPTWKLAEIPKYLKPDELQSLLEACDRTTPVGRRDYSILLLLARLGLRAGEVVTLELDDINWRAAELTIRGKGQFRDCLPLPQEVGKSLAIYLQNDRPICPTRRVFIRMRAPCRGFKNSTTISTIVRRAVERSGLDTPSKGAHLLRYSLATEMLRQGASMTEIGELLRHRSSTTYLDFLRIIYRLEILTLHLNHSTWYKKNRIKVHLVLSDFTQTRLDKHSLVLEQTKPGESDQANLKDGYPMLDKFFGELTRNSFARSDALYRTLIDKTPY